MFGFIKTLKPAAPLLQAKVPKTYLRYRIQIFLTIFIGYAVFYFVRKNLSFAKPFLINELGYSKTEVGAIAAGMPLAYGLSKFIMGAISDKCNPRFFMGLALIFSGFLNLFFGSSTNITFFIIIWTLNGWVQGMGWPPCGKTMAYWFSDRERGTWMSIWNVAHNIGGMLVPFVVIFGINHFSGNWTGAFFFPALISIGCGILIMIFLRDRPVTLGLPAIENYKSEKTDEEEGAWSTVFNHVLKNRYLWYIALANAFVYFLRYGIMDWISVYLTECKNMDIQKAGWAFFMYEFAAIPGTILIGWITDKYFHGRRTPMGIFCMIGTVVACLIYMLSDNPFMIHLAVASIGLLIYGPVALIGITAIDISAKKAAGAAAGFTGLFGYVGGAVCAEILIGRIIDLYGWNIYFLTLLISAILAILFLCPTWNLKNVSGNF